MAAGGSKTHPFTVQQQMSPEDGGVTYGHLLVPVQDLEDAAVHGALVDAGRVQAAGLCKTGGRGAVSPRALRPQPPWCRPAREQGPTPFPFLLCGLGQATESEHK